MIWVIWKLTSRTFGRLVGSALDLKKVMKGHPFLGSLRFLLGLMVGRRFKDQLRKHTNAVQTVEVTILPFEEPHSLESERLERCGAMFAYLDPDTEEVKFVPFCAWCLYRRETYRRIADKYAARAAV